MLARCVRFLFLPACAKSAHVFQTFLLALRTLSLSFPTNNSSSDSKAFLRFIAFSGSPTAVHCAFLFFRCEGMASHKLTCTTVLHCAHTFLRRIDLLHSIACTTVLHWAYLSEPLVKDSHIQTFDGKHYTACSKSRDHTLPLHTCYGEVRGEVYGNIAREENG